MRKILREIKVELWKLPDLPVEEQKLIYKALSARLKAQAPYSHYWVGAAVRSESGQIYRGCNVETASWTQTTHAEQNAITSMVAEEGPVKLTAMAIVSAPAGEKPNLTPRAETNPEARVEDFCFACGHCLQIAWENCLGDTEVPLLLLTSWGEIARTTIEDAFPMRFGPISLGVDILRRD